MTEKGPAFKELKYLFQDLDGFGGAEVTFESQPLSNLALSLVNLKGSTIWRGTVT